MVNVSTYEALELFQQGSEALSHAERAGIRIDTDYLRKASRKMERQMSRLVEQLQEADEFKLWRKRFGGKTKLGSYSQLAAVVYDDLGHECKAWTSGGKTGVKKRKADKDSLERVDSDFVRNWLRMKRLEKANSTYLTGLLREVVDGYIHPVCHLHFVETFRSSYGSPNIQNQPNRDPEIAEIIRNSFVARSDDHVFLEIDLAQAEVRASCSYHLDPVLIKYMSGGGDLHLDMAAECFKLKKSQVTKPIRQNAKNQMVFPMFYGSYYPQTAKGMWDYVAQNNLMLGDASLYEHLAAHGIHSLGACSGDARPVPGTFEHHVQKVESKFWNEWLKVYTVWKKEWYAEYQREGGFRLLTGFWVEGIMSRNECLNTPIQGVAFHWLLWSLIQMHRWLRKNRMRTKIVGQVHDSLLIDCHKGELSDVLAKAKQTFTVDLPRHWDWIVTPIEVEAEASPPGGSWYAKKKVEL